MSAKQDRQGARTIPDIERKYNFGKTFAEIMGIATDAHTAAEKAQAATENLDKELTAEEIFNRLTNNGEVQGIYRDEKGDIYLNASYIKSGELLADLIKVGILQSKDGKSFYLDLENGVLKGQFDEFSVSGKTVDAIAQEKANTAESNAKSYANTAAANAVSKQTQTDIFNKLTNNGALPGLFMKDGQLYINASYIVSGVIDAALVTVKNLIADSITSGVLKSSDGTVSLDLSGNSFVVSMPSNGAVRTMNFMSSGLSGYGEDLDTGKLHEVLIVQPAILGTNGAKTTSIMSSSGADLVLAAASSAYAASGFVQIGTVASSKVKIKGKTVSWKDNGDGTYTLIGTD